MVRCKICGWEGKQIGTGHLKTHQITAARYKQKFPGANLTSQAVRDAIREKAKLRPPASEETNKKISETMKAVYRQTHFPLHKKNQNQCGDKNHFFGRTHSEKTRKRIGNLTSEWLRQAYATGAKISPFAHLGNGKQSSKIEKAVLALVGKFGFIHNFRVPFPKGGYQIDFAIPWLKLAIELDSKLHQLQKMKLRDRRKDAFLTSNGWRVVRLKTNAKSNPEQLASRMVMAYKIQRRRRHENKNNSQGANHGSSLRHHNGKEP